MKDIVVISTSPGRENWVKEILESITRPVLVVSEFGYELGKIKWIFENTNCDRFLFLQDSLVIRDESLFDQVFEAHGSSCIMDVPSCLGSYMGVYEREVLSRIEIPVITTKSESIRFETEWTQEYIRACDSFSHPLAIVHKELETVRKFGRENLLYINQYYEKWKGDWGVYVPSHEPLIDPVSMERVNLQMLEKSRTIQSLTQDNLRLNSEINCMRDSSLIRETAEKQDLEILKLLEQKLDQLKHDIELKNFEVKEMRESTSRKLFEPYRIFIEFLKSKRP